MIEFATVASAIDDEWAGGCAAGATGHPIMKGAHSRRGNVAGSNEPSIADGTLKAALGAAGIGRWTFDLATGEADWDAAAARLLESECDGSVAGVPALRNIGIRPRDIVRLAAAVQASLQTRNPVQGELRLLGRDGRTRWLSVTAAWEDEADRLQLAGIVSDVTAAKTAAQALIAGNSHYATIIDHSMLGIVQIDPGARILVANDRVCEMLGRSKVELNGTDFFDLAHPDDREAAAAQLRRHLQTGEPLRCEMRCARPDGSFIWCTMRAPFVRTGEGRTAIISLGEDTGLRRDAERDVQSGRDLLQTVVDSVADLIFVKDRAGRFVLTNRALDEGCGELTGRRVDDAFPLPLTSVYDSLDKQVMATGKVCSIDAIIPIKGRQRTFHTIKVPWIKDGEIAGVIGVSRDITERKEAEARVRWSALHDPATGLPNRTLFSEFLTQAIESAAQDRAKLGLLHLDIDHFKQINDGFGHQVGDHLIKAIAERLQASLRPQDSIARLGGDEFAIILPDARSASEVERVATSLLAVLAEPFHYAGRRLECRASIGASLYPDHGVQGEQLLRNADVALYAAKASSRGSFKLFQSEMRVEQQERLSMINVARDALNDQRIAPSYQPKVELGTGRIIGFEALLRWQHRGRRNQLPGMIGAAFEDAELAAAISDRIIDCTIADMRHWIDAGLDFGHIAINASAAEFRRGDFGERLLEKLFRAGVPCRRLQLEVTETVFLGRGAESVGRALDLLSAEGVDIALDDFGTGYASLRHLKQFPVDVLKIDQNFVRNMATDREDAAIIDAVLNLGRGLGIDVVAEGIETEAQATYLKRLGCRYGQGYLFSPAVPAGRATPETRIARSR